MKLPELRDFLGTDFSAVPLKPIGLRARNTLKPWLIRQPRRAMSFRIETGDGRRLKLLHFGRTIADRRATVEERLRALASLQCVPTLVWSDPANLVTEWVEGEAPAADDPHFARRLAEIFADLYRVDFEERARGDLVSELLRLLDAGPKLVVRCLELLLVHGDFTKQLCVAAQLLTELV